MNWWSKLSLNKTEDQLKRIIIIAALGIFIGIISSTAFGLSNSPDFCMSCHEMKPEYYTWKATSHNRISCTECHIKPGLGNLVVYKISSLKELFLHAMKAYDNPIRMDDEEQVPNAVCQKCHSPRRLFTTLGDLIIPHDKHLKEGVRCVSCHAGVAHGRIAERKVSQVISYTNWDDYQGKEETSRHFTTPGMDACISCHSERGVSKRCETCHTTYSTPTDHDDKGWSTSHGLTARVDAYSCRKCHAYGSDLAVVRGGDALSKVTKGTSFCYNCHNTRPTNHGWYKTIWMAEHKKVVEKRGKPYCIACHNINKPSPDEQATKTYCNKCHLF